MKMDALSSFSSLTPPLAPLKPSSPTWEKIRSQLATCLQSPMLEGSHYFTATKGPHKGKQYVAWFRVKDGVTAIHIQLKKDYDDSAENRETLTKSSEGSVKIAPTFHDRDRLEDFYDSLEKGPALKEPPSLKSSEGIPPQPAPVKTASPAIPKDLLFKTISDHLGDKPVTVSLFGFNYVVKKEWLEKLGRWNIDILKPFNEHIQFWQNETGVSHLGNDPLTQAKIKNPTMLGDLAIIEGCAAYLSTHKPDPKLAKEIPLEKEKSVVPAPKAPIPTDALFSTLNKCLAVKLQGGKAVVEIAETPYTVSQEWNEGKKTWFVSIQSSQTKPISLWEDKEGISYVGNERLDKAPAAKVEIIQRCAQALSTRTPIPQNLFFGTIKDSLIVTWKGHAFSFLFSGGLYSVTHKQKEGNWHIYIEGPKKIDLWQDQGSGDVFLGTTPLSKLDLQTLLLIQECARLISTQTPKSPLEKLYEEVFSLLKEERVVRVGKQNYYLSKEKNSLRIQLELSVGKKSDLINYTLSFENTQEKPGIFLGEDPISEVPGEMAECAQQCLQEALKALKPEKSA